jgi:hypothetical protein
MWLGAVRKWNEKVRNLWYPLGVENQVQHANISTFFRVEFFESVIMFLLPRS